MKINYDIQYIHVFDNQNDFSGTSLGTDGFDGWEPIKFESFSDHLDGGVYGWTYGIWAGDKAWDESKFYEKREEDSSLEGLRDKMGKVSKEDLASREGFRGSFGDELLVTYKIATTIDSQLIYATRRGGDAYWKIRAPLSGPQPMARL